MKKELPFLKALALMACLLCAFSTMAQEAYAEFTANDSTLTFYYDNLRNTRTGTTYDLNFSIFPGWHELRDEDDYIDEIERYSSSVRKVVFDPSFAAARPTTTCYWFEYMTKLQSITGMEYLNTSEVTDMSHMFAWCYELPRLDLSNFDTRNVASMEGMFSECRSMPSIDLSSFNTANVKEMSFMFAGCESLTSLDLSNFNTSNVEWMAGMFGSCGVLSLDLSGFDTRNVREMLQMFFGCRRLVTLDLTNFDTGNVMDIDAMFYGCINLSTIYAGNDWNTDRVTSYSGYMFDYCDNLVGGMGTKYDWWYTDKTYARIDGGPEKPGYFTAAQTVLPGDVDGDGKLGITDVTDLIDLLLNGGEMPSVADVDGDGIVNITDVVALIDILLSEDN